MIPYLILISVPVILGAKHIYEYSIIIDKYTFGYPERIAALLFILYIIFIVFLGMEKLFELQTYARGGRRYMTFFVYPSFGFGLAIFPKAASHFTGMYDQLASTGMARGVAIWGWFAIVYVAIIVVF